MNKQKILAVIATTFLLTALATQADERQGFGFLERKAEGWFWYEVKEDPVVEPEPEPEPQVATAKPQEPEPPAAVTPGPKPFSAAWFRENLDKYKDAAWDNPTIENLEAYLYLQRFAVDRSQQFSDVAEMAVLGNPMLDEITRRPTATYGTKRVDRVAGRIRDETIAQLAQTVGIFFFYDAQDDYSQISAPVVKLLEQSGFHIVAISHDGEPIEGFENDFDYRIDMGHAEQLGIRNLPALFLVSAQGEFAPIGQGVMSLTDISHRLLVSAKREGWITEEQYSRTRPITSNTNLADHLAYTPEQASELQGDSENNNFVEPKQLLEYIKKQTRNHAVPGENQ